VEMIAGWCGNRLAVRLMTWPSVKWASGADFSFSRSNRFDTLRSFGCDPPSMSGNPRAPQEELRYLQQANAMMVTAIRGAGSVASRSLRYAGETLRNIDWTGLRELIVPDERARALSVIVTEFRLAGAFPRRDCQKIAFAAQITEQITQNVAVSTRQNVCSS
jgi:hypothetical protein